MRCCWQARLIFGFEWLKKTLTPSDVWVVGFPYYCFLQWTPSSHFGLYSSPRFWMAPSVSLPWMRWTRCYSRASLFGLPAVPESRMASLLHYCSSSSLAMHYKSRRREKHPEMRCWGQKYLLEASWGDAPNHKCYRWTSYHCAKEVVIAAIDN